MRRCLSLLLLVAVLSGCAVRSVRTPPLPDSSADEARGLLPLGNCVVTADYALTESLDRLVADSTWVVEGVVEAMTGTRNLNMGPDKGLMIEGVDFRVRVERYLKGEGPASVTISLGRSTRQKGEERACRHQDYVEPAPGSRWILFLRPSPAFPDLAAPAGSPWRYLVAEGNAVPVLPGGPHTSFPSTTVEELVKQVQP